MALEGRLGTETVASFDVELEKAVPLKSVFRSVAELDSYLDAIQHKTVEEG